MVKTTYEFKKRSTMNNKARVFINKGYAVYTKKTPEGYKLFRSKRTLPR